MINEQQPIESQIGPDDIIDTQTDNTDIEKDHVQKSWKVPRHLRMKRK